MVLQQNPKMSGPRMTSGAFGGLPAFVKAHMTQGEASASALHCHAGRSLFASLSCDTGHNVSAGTAGSGKTFFMPETLRCRGGNHE